MSNTNKLIEEFNNMDKLPMFEIEHLGEYYIYNIEINEEELTTDCGISVDLEEDETLDYHLEGLYELCYEDVLSQETREELTQETSYVSVNKLDEILESMNNGHWSEAQEDFKAINITPREFSDWLSDQDIEVSRDFALLGYYTRDYEPLEDSSKYYTN